MIARSSLVATLLGSIVVATAHAQLPKRCGFPDRSTMTGGAFAPIPSDCSYVSTTIKPEYDPYLVYEIPVVFHVIQNTSGAGYLSPATIQDQIDVLNEDYQALPGSLGAPGINTRIRFRLASVDPSGNPTTGITYSTNNTWYQDSGQYWNTLAWDTNRYLNVYTNYPAGYFGYVPDWPQGGIVGKKLDRVVVWWEAVGKQPTAGWPLNRGRTLTHEIGHYFGLDHPFVTGCPSVANCYSNGDLICDTNPQSTETFGCPTSKSSCGFADAIHNYMDYSDDPCIWEFTPEQVNRMRCTLQHWRPNLAVECNPPFGHGCAGSGGFVPSLDVNGCAMPAMPLSFSISKGLGGSSAFLFVGLTQGSQAMGAGCTLNVSPLLSLVVGPLPLAGVGPGTGALQFFADLPASATSATFTLQAFVADAGGPLGFCNSPGVSVPIQ